ncbi:cyclin-A1-1-like [Camellia sinensis]|uniref:cyclin-A1-1-like n=1 Tax=Camellia sinensis TaxID=4442 RepID=UPI001036E9D0|nr:cyclin-A1-1-like [Camellia sinensis]
MPRTDLVERIQGDINASMRAILIDWLVEVAEEYSFVPETLFLTVNYIDRYLSGNVIQRQRIQLLGVACMMIAAKYEEICAPQVEEFCYVADNTYFKKEVLQMESSVLNYLKFEMSAPTAGCFLTRFVRAAQGINEFVMQIKQDSINCRHKSGIPGNREVLCHILRKYILFLIYFHENLRRFME